VGLTRQNPGIAKIMDRVTVAPLWTERSGLVFSSGRPITTGCRVLIILQFIMLSISAPFRRSHLRRRSWVIVYAGWNDRGYGNVVVIDHGNGWQSLYAHMNAVNVNCGQSVYQGDLIGRFGSTGIPPARTCTSRS